MICSKVWEWSTIVITALISSILTFGLVLGLLTVVLKRLIKALPLIIDGYVVGLSHDVVKNPEKYAGMLQKPVEMVVSKLIDDFRKANPALADAAEATGGGGSMLDMLPIPKKYKEFAQLVMMLMGRNNKPANQQQTNKIG